MKTVFQHDLTTSFKYWVSHTLASEGQGYSNKSTSFYKTIDAQIPSGYYVYAAPFKETLADSSVSGATIISGLWLDGVFRNLSYDDPNNIYDFTNSRFITTGNYNSVSGDYATQEFNVYTTNEDEEDLIFSRQYKVNSPYSLIQTAVQPYDNTVPCAFVSTSYTNEPYEIGGRERSVIDAKIVFFAENNYQLDSALGIFNDKVRTSFGEIGFANDPFNEFIQGSNSLKSSYNYINKAVMDVNSQYFVDEVSVSRLKDNMRASMNQKFFVGFVDLTISRFRFPRS